MAYTRIAFPDFTQSDTQPHKYQLGTFDAAAGQWCRVVLSFDVMPLSTGTDGSTGSYYGLLVQAPDGSYTELGDGQVIGGPLWFRGGVIGAFEALIPGIYTIFYTTSAGPGLNPSGCCHYENMVLVVDTPMVLTPGTPPVTILTVAPAFDVYTNGSPIDMGWFPAVAGQAYTLICAFDATTTNGTLSYTLAGGFTGYPDVFQYSDSAWAKCFLTGVATAKQTGNCEVDLVAIMSAGQATIANFTVIATPFVPPIAP